MIAVHFCVQLGHRRRKNRRVNLDDYVRHDAMGLVELVRTRRATAAEILDVAFRAIAEVNPRLNAVVEVTESHARQLLLRALPDGKLRGAPFLIKDSLERTGLKASWGCTLAKENISKRTHEVARRIDDAGLLTIGRTNMSELGLLPSTEGALHGPAHNPWDTTLSPGGSSGGAAAAVAAGIVPCAHAEDGGGSIRIPASACGLWGLKAGRGRLPQEPWDSPDAFVMHGVVSRTVRDSALMLDVLAGARPFDRWQAPPPRGSYLEAASRDPKPLRIGFTTRTILGDESHPDCCDAVDQAARLFAAFGHDVEEVRVELDGEAFAAHFTTIWAMATGYFIRAALETMTPMNVPPAVRRVMVDPNVFSAIAWATNASQGLPPLERMTRRLIKINAKLTPADHWMAWSKLNEVAQPLFKAFDRYDVILTPTLATPPWRTGTFTLGETDAETGRKLMRYAGFTPIGNTTGLPAMSLPLHWNHGGIPIGVQVMGRFGAEQVLLALAGQAERATAAKRPVPRVWVGN